MTGELSGMTSLTMDNSSDGSISDVTNLTMSGDLKVTNSGTLSVADTITSYGRIYMYASDFAMWDSSRGGSDNSNGRALVHYNINGGSSLDTDDQTKANSILYINYSNDFGAGIQLGVNSDSSNNPGYVGIGGTPNSYGYTLEVNGDTYIDGSAVITSNLTLSTGDLKLSSGSISVSDKENIFGVTLIGSDAYTNDAVLQHSDYANGTTGNFAFLQEPSSSGSNGRTMINAAENQTISFTYYNETTLATISETEYNIKLPLSVSDDLSVTGSCTANGFTSNSDERLKTDIKQITNPIDKISNINGVNFAWKKDKTRETQSGLIAQEVEKVIPEVVKTIKRNTSNNKEDENELEETKTIDYNGMIGYLVECIKQQQSDINDLRNELQSLKNKSGE